MNPDTKKLTLFGHSLAILPSPNETQSGSKSRCHVIHIYVPIHACLDSNAAPEFWQ